MIRAKEEKLIDYQASSRPKLRMLTKDVWWLLSVVLYLVIFSLELSGAQVQWKGNGAGESKILTGEWLQ